MSAIWLPPHTSAKKRHPGREFVTGLPSVDEQTKTNQQQGLVEFVQ